MDTTLHKCKACGKEYYHCDDCGAIDSYKKICCSDDCYSVFYIVSRYLIDGDVTKAANSLELMGKTRGSERKYIPSVASALKKIMQDTDDKEKDSDASNRQEQVKSKKKKTK